MARALEMRWRASTPAASETESVGGERGGCGSGVQFCAGHPAARSAECGREREEKTKVRDRGSFDAAPGIIIQQTEFGLWSAGLGGT